MLSWDTLYLYLDPAAPKTPYQSRKVRRKLSTLSYHPLKAYLRTWMILSAFMLSGGANALHPFSTSISALQQTVSRCHALTEIVDFSITTHLYYSSYRFDEIQSLFPSSSTLEEEVAHLSKSEESHHFHPSTSSSSLEEPFLTSGQQHFFPSYTNLSEMEGDIMTYDYQLCLEPSWTDTLFDFQGLQEPHQHILSYLHQEDHFLTSSTDLLPTNFRPQVYTALTQPTLGQVDLYPLNSMPSSFPLIIDSGASLAISPSEADFIGPITYYATERTLGGMAGGIKIKGIGKIAWSFKTEQGILTVHSKCYLVPNASARLLSPQRLFSAANNINGRFSCMEKFASLEFDNVGSLKIEYDPNNHLPIALAKNLSGTQAQINLAILNDENQNLTPSQKLLLTWHSRFGHKGFTALQRLLKQYPFDTERFKAASRCITPRCEVCEYAKAHRKGTKGVKQSINQVTDGSLKKDDLTPGSSISVDHFESRLKGRTLASRGRSTETYKGGCIFVDHMSGYVHVE